MYSAPGCAAASVCMSGGTAGRGGNRLSMTLTLVGDGEDLFLSAITSGGSQGMFFKFNTWGGIFSWIPSGNWRRAGYDFAAAGRGRNDSLDRFDCFFYSFSILMEKRLEGWLFQEDEAKMRLHGIWAGALF